MEHIYENIWELSGNGSLELLFHAVYEGLQKWSLSIDN